MRDNWQLFESAVTSEACEHMIQTFSKLPESQGSTFNNDQEHRKSKVRWVYNESHLIQMLLHYANLANATAFNVDIQQEMAEMQFTEYSANCGGKYSWHHDVNWENSKNFDRKLSVVLQLSDPDTYKGGDFMFSEVQSPVENQIRKQGSILVFPSYLQHQVTEVTEGVRYSLVSWIRGPRWR